MKVNWYLNQYCIVNVTMTEAKTEFWNEYIWNQKGFDSTQSGPLSSLFYFVPQENLTAKLAGS